MTWQRSYVLLTHHLDYMSTSECFGVASSPAQFQRCIDSIVAGLPGVVAYMDDLIVTGVDEESHWRHLDINLVSK